MNIKTHLTVGKDGLAAIEAGQSPYIPLLQEGFSRHHLKSFTVLNLPNDFLLGEEGQED